MEIPKYIDKLLEQRAKAAELFLSADTKIGAWLEKNNINVGEEHIYAGACSICEPRGSIETIRKIIKEHKKEK